MNLRDLFFWRRRASAIQSDRDLLSEPGFYRAEDHIFSPPSNNIQALRVLERWRESVSETPELFHNKPESLTDRPIQALTRGGPLPVSPAAPLPVSNACVLYTRKCVASIPNYSPHHRICSFPIFNETYMRRQDNNQPNWSIGSLNTAFIDGLLNRATGLRVFQANPPRMAYDWFPFDLDYLTGDSQISVALYRSNDPTNDMDVSFSGFAPNYTINLFTNVVRTLVADNAPGPIPTDAIMALFILEQHRALPLTDGSLLSADGLFNTQLITHYNPLAFVPGQPDIESQLDQERRARMIGRYSFVYTGGHYKHYRLIVHTPSMPLAYPYGFGANLYAAMGSAKATELVAAETYGDTFLCEYESAVPIAGVIESGKDIRTGAGDKNPQLFVIDFDEHDYRGIEFIGIDLRAFNMTSGVGNVNMQRFIVPNYPWPLQASANASLPFTSIMNSGWWRDHEPMSETEWMGLSAFEDTDGGDHGALVNALLGPWSNIDLETVSAAPRGSRSHRRARREAVQISANVYLVGINE